MISDETFFAWLDGELDAEEAATVGAAVAADPDMQRRADGHRALTERLRAALDPIAQAPVPAHLQESIHQNDSDVIDFAVRHRARVARPMPVRMQWAAMAATLALGIFAGTMINRGSGSPIGQEDGRMVATNELEAALYTRLASAPADSGPRIGLTFRDTAGNLCRSFTDDGAAGLACHQGGDWRIHGLFQSGEGQQGEFRMAAGADPRLAALVDAAIAGDPFDASAESRALEALR